MGGKHGPIEVRAVQFPQDARAFVLSWWKIYEGDPCWVPPLLRDILGFLDPRVNPYFKVATIQPFMAFRGGQAVGTIAATLDHWTRDHHPGVGYFGFFEFIDDADVASALYEAAAKWFREQGVHTVRGPFNFNLNHEFGLLVSRFDDPPCVANPHNGHWYPGIYEKVLKLEKARDWYAYWMGYGPVPGKIKAISDRFMSRHPNVRLRPMDKQNFEKDCEIFWGLYNDAWQENWGNTHMDKDEFMFKALQLRPVLDEKLAMFVYVDDEPAGASITLPDYNQVAIHMNGRLFPFGWWHYASRHHYLNRMRVLVLGVRQKFQNMPLGAPMYVATWEECKRRGIYRGVEASLIVEDNHRMRGALEKLGGIIHKTYRTYEQRIDGQTPEPQGS
jgi:GNAT superfamily N-acetyltransferase